jgi:hypothetical protein
MEGAKPAIGTVGNLQVVDEDKVEIVCLGKECMRKAVDVLKRVHPYEVVPYYVVEMLDV